MEGSCTTLTLTVDRTLTPTQPHPRRYACMEDTVIYAASLYWSVMTITSIG
jgi:hypothetical protein